jgi:uncharacterized protein YicC (UPF0701 family)
MEDHTELIKQIARELALASHQSKDKEVSGLFADIKRRMETIESNLISVKEDITKIKDLLDDKVTPNINSWNSNTETLKWVNRVVITAVILGILALIGIGK